MDDQYEASYASAVMPVFEWVKACDWVGTYQQYLGDFYSDLTELADIPAVDVLAELPKGFFAKAVRCCFDHFLTIEYESNPSNALDQYLDEVGMNLMEADVDFLIAFRTSAVRIFQVVERTPYESVVLRDLSGGPRPIQIEDEMLTAGLAAGDNIATRIITVKEKDYLAGPVLILSAEILDPFKDAFEETFKSELRTLEKYLQKDLRQRSIVRQRILRASAPHISTMWVAWVLAELGEMPPFATENDPDTVFEGTLGYDGPLEAVEGCLDAHPDIDRLIPKEFVWVWRRDREDPEASFKAMIWISGPSIFLESCEISRLDEAVAELKDMLGDAVGEVVIEEFDLDDEEEGDDEWLPPVQLPAEEAGAYRDRVHEYIGEHLHSLLESPCEALSNQIPRELANSVKGRKRLVKWLEAVESNMRSTTDQLEISPYDCKWMWKELGIESHRQSSLFDE